MTSGSTSGLDKNEMNSGESRRIVPCLRDGSLEEVVEVAKAITGLLS